ncbi:MAG: cysteine hydrolase family protein [Nitrosopumilus sp.]|uniref:cysteine hydrolase family protein n=1 Tax=Nitrosopumilus sp. TaxID=2024843 RepID=UPI00292D55EB|nr:cysteine hydrolase [Nitrosopumilus sp.]
MNTKQEEKEKTTIDLATTAVLIIDPQNDFLSEGGAVWDLVGSEVQKNNVVEKLQRIIQTAKNLKVPVVYSPHYYTEEEYENWKHLNFVDRVMFERKMFHKGTWGAEFHSELKSDENTIVLSPHKGLSNFATGDINIQLRQRNIKTLIIAGMSANLCVESHVRDAAEHAFDVITIKDATAGPGEAATQAALTNFEFLSDKVMTTDEIVTALEGSVPMVQIS